MLSDRHRGCFSDLHRDFAGEEILHEAEFFLFQLEEPIQLTLEPHLNRFRLHCNSLPFLKRGTATGILSTAVM